jgi:hypothetical protein
MSSSKRPHHRVSSRAIARDPLFVLRPCNKRQALRPTRFCCSLTTFPFSETYKRLFSQPPSIHTLTNGWGVFPMLSSSLPSFSTAPRGAYTHEHPQAHSFHALTSHFSAHPGVHPRVRAGLHAELAYPSRASSFPASPRRISFRGTPSTSIQPIFRLTWRQWTPRPIAGTLLVTRRVSPRAVPPTPVRPADSQEVPRVFRLPHQSQNESEHTC